MKVVVLLLAVALVGADVYMHNPRGSNNRLNEASANRNNANRLFDSQNNNRGGYNVGDRTDKAAKTEADQYQMKYFQSGPEYKILNDGQGSTRLTLEWTNQHGCGGNEDTDPHKQNCQIVLQYMCQSTAETNVNLRLRDGLNTNTQKYTPSPTRSAPPHGDVDASRGLQESWFWYNYCYTRERNKGLFTADQKLDDNALGYSSAIFTRQNPNGNRYGYECPEERDYYPYFHTSPWKDIAVLAENETMCSYFKEHSFNVKPKFECFQKSGNSRIPSRYNNEEDCTANGGTWTEMHNYLEKVPGKDNRAECEASSSNGIQYIFAVPYDTTNNEEECLVKLDEPECYQAPWSRSNHLGNGRDAVALNYTWTIPYFPSGDTQRCVLRIRYNISTDDYDPYFTNASYNQDIENNVQSPVQQNPYVEVGGNYPLRLAINTAQFGRTFQDRSHVFLLEKRPPGTERARILNLNVRGKRGNIVQVYPAVEYDFVPNDLQVREDDMIHMQWTGSNTHNNGNPGGDGQTGDAGEGTGGTDRNNIVQIRDLNENYPVPYENSTMWQDAEVVWIQQNFKNPNDREIAIILASSGYFQCLEAGDCGADSVERKGALNNLLNNAPASFPGAMLKLKKGVYHYICSRNNNFSNRSQKGKITVN